jgi:hypothetical protein
LLREEDQVLKSAKQCIVDTPPAHVATLLAAVYEATFGVGGIEIDLRRVQANSFVQQVFAGTPDYRRQTWSNLAYDTEYGADEDEETDLTDRGRSYDERFADDVDALVELNGFEVLDERRVRVNLPDVRSIQALLLDGSIRYDYKSEVLLKFVFEVLDVMAAFGLGGLDEQEDLPAD